MLLECRAVIPSESRFVVDGELPFNIQWGESGVSYRLYWYAVDLNNEFLKIAISESTGFIQNVVYLKKSFTYYPDYQYQIEPGTVVEQGYPLFDSNHFRGRDTNMLREKVNFVLTVGRNCMVVHIGDAKKIYRIVTSGRVHFGFTQQNELMQIAMTDISAEEMNNWGAYHLKGKAIPLARSKPGFATKVRNWLRAR